MAAIMNGFKKCFLTTLLILFGIYIAGCATTQRFVKQGRQLASQGDWDRSVQLFQQAHEENPEDQEIKLLLSTV